MYLPVDDIASVLEHINYISSAAKHTVQLKPMYNQYPPDYSKIENTVYGLSNFLLYPQGKQGARELIQTMAVIDANRGKVSRPKQIISMIHFNKSSVLK